jgi:hypothetical protein
MPVVITIVHPPLSCSDVESIRQNHRSTPRAKEWQLCGAIEKSLTISRQLKRRSLFSRGSRPCVSSASVFKLTTKNPARRDVDSWRLLQILQLRKVCRLQNLRTRVEKVRTVRRSGLALTNHISV